MLAYYGSSISGNMVRTPEGFLICRNVPIARTTAAGAVRPGSAIEQMSDREFAAFSKRAQEAMMAGKKVRME